MVHRDWFAQLRQWRVGLIFLVSSESLFDKLQRCLLRTIHCKMQTKRCVMSLKQDFTTCSSGIVFLMFFLLAFMILLVISSCHFFKIRRFVTLAFGSCSIPHSFLHSGDFLSDKRPWITCYKFLPSHIQHKSNLSQKPSPFPLAIDKAKHSALKRPVFCLTAIRNSILKSQSSCSHLD